MSFDWLMELSDPVRIAALGEIIFVNIVLSGDNAVVVGMAAAGLPRHLQNRAILYGILAATVLRIVFAAVAQMLLSVPGLTLVGGLLLLGVAWNMARELRAEEEAEDEHSGAPEKTIWTAITQIIIADVSMSLDNVLAVAGVARTDVPVLVIGLVTSILFMGLASKLIAGLLDRFRWISWVGLALIVYVAAEMLWDGVPEAWHYAHPFIEKFLPH